MWSAPFYWPMPDALALTEHLAGLSIVSSPIQWLGGSPLLAYNVVLIASLWWSALAVHTLVRRLTRHDAAAWCAGVIWGLAPYRASQLSHLQVLVTWWMPIGLLALHAYYEDGRRRWLALFGVAWLLQSLSNGYYMFFFPVLIAGWIAVFTPWRSGERRRALAVLAAWVVFSLPLLSVLREYYIVQHRLGLARTRSEMQMFGATWASFAHAAPLLRFWPSLAPRTQEDFLFPGLTPILVVIAGLLFARRRLLTRTFVFYAGGALFFAWMAAGPSPDQWSVASLWHPYDWVAWLPGYGGLRVPARFFMLATLCLAVAAGLSVASIAAGRRGRLIVLVVVLAAVADGWIVAMPLGAPPRPFGTALVGGAHVLELPLDDDNVNVSAMYRETSHHLPVVNGYAGYVPSQITVIDWALRRHDASVLTELRRGHPLYVAVANRGDAEPWTAFMDAQNDAQMVGVSGAGRLYLLPPAPFAPVVTLGPPLAVSGAAKTDGWLTFDLGSERSIRALELRTRGHFILLGETVRVETSLDGATWTTADEERPGGLALQGALREPLAVPIRIVLRDPSARYVRVNTPAFRPADVTIIGP